MEYVVAVGVAAVASLSSGDAAMIPNNTFERTATFPHVS